jgi:gluconolactonase
MTRGELLMAKTSDAVEVKDAAILHLIDPDAPIEQLCTGFRFSEGPIWNPREQCLYFSDMPSDIRRRWSAREGVVQVRNPSNKCNGMTYDGAGNLYVCEHVTSSLVMETAAGERKVLATHWQGKELNSPNDVVIRSDGAIYFTDPTYGRMPVFGLERKQELDFQGVYRIARGGTLHREADDFSQPNGLCFSPDEKILYVNDTTRAHIRAFDVAPDGSLSHSRIFAEGVGTGDYNEGVVDGMKGDEHGNIYVTGPRGIWVISARGTHLGVIRMPEIAGNLNWGGRGWNELYCACTTSIYRVRMNVRGNQVAYMRTFS